MNTVKIDSAGVVGEIISSRTNIINILNDSFTFHYLPEAKIDLKKQADIIVEEKEQDIPVILNYPKITIFPLKDHRGLVSACDYLLERARQEKLGIYSLNSSSVQKDGKAVVFFGGATNLGKKSSALELAAKGFELFSDEKTLLNLKEKTLYSGPKSLALRKKILREKTGFSNEFQSFKECSCKYPNLSLIILPHLDHGLEDPIKYKLKEKDAFWHLNKELTRRIRGDTKFVGNFCYPLQSIDNEILSLERVNSIKELVKTVPVYYFQGNLNQLNNFVTEKFNNKK